MRELEAIARGEMDASAARQVLTEFLSTPSDRMLQKVYSALARVCSTMLSDKRPGAELRSWHRLVCDVSARVAAQDPSLSEISLRLEGISDLLKVAALRTGDDRPNVEQIMQQAYVPEILRALSQADPHALERHALREQLGIQEAVLVHILSCLRSAGLVDQMGSGQSALVQLSALGERHLWIAANGTPLAPYQVFQTD